ncbi:MAG: DUF4835 family protein [Salibacteraceae bacterium]
MKLKRLYSALVLFLVLLVADAGAQELNCRVEINSSKVENSDKAVFDALQRSVYEFMNSRRWTSDRYEPDERIECSVLITIEKQLSVDQFEATFQITSTRPVYGSTYKTTLFNYRDESVPFKYLQFDVLDFSDNAYISELTSVLGFYAYVILAMDYDSYAPMGGQEYWQKAQRVVNNAQSGGGNGWMSHKSRTNRYWLVQNYLNDRFKGLRQCIYHYHRKGLDQMAENAEQARAEITKALKMIEPVHKAEPNSFNVRLFFTAKSDEIVKIYSKARPEEKNEIISLLETIDPANTNKYGRIRAGGI